MIGMRRPGHIAISVVFAVLLLLGEYWLLQNNARQRHTERLRLWGAYSLNTLNLRMQSALDFAVILARTPRDSASPTADILPQVSAAVAANTLFDGVALVQEVSDRQRPAFEVRQNHPIQTLQNHHSRVSPQKSYYYPVIDYMPDDANSFARGLDLGAASGWNAKFTQAENTTKPVLAAYREPDAASSRIDVLVAMPQDHRYLLLNLSQERLLDIPLPNGDAFLHNMRLIAWEKDNNDRPLLLLDSHPNLAAPTEAPVASLSSKLGGMEILLGTYSLNDNVTIGDSPLAILWLSAAGALLLLALLSRLAYRNDALQAQSAQQNTQLAQNNQILRQQITERMHSEQARTESEMRQRAILEASSDAIILIDHNGIITNANPAAARLAEQSAESLTLLPVGVLFSELYDSNRQYNFQAIASNFEGMPFEAQLICSSTRKLPVELSLSRVVLPDDMFFMAVFRNISVRKEQEAALIRLKNSLAEQVEMQSRQLAALLDASPLAMAYIVDRHLKQVNHAFLELFDCDESTAISFTTRQFYLSDEQYERTGRQLYHLLNEGKVLTTELQLQTGSGNLIWCRLHGKALNPSVPGLGSIWLYQDFSSERAAEDALRAAKELAEDTSRSKTEFLANMSHELRTPMHAILGFAEMGQSRAEQAQQEKIRLYFERILSSGNRLLSLLNDLLDLAKMEVGRMEYHLEENDLEPQLRETCEELGSQAEIHGIHITLDCQPTPLFAQFDALRISQVMRNLLSNAIKFSAQGGGIEISARILSGTPHPLVQVSVSDHGPGIPHTELESIFEKFIQSSSTKTGAGGTGLGLAICREIIHAHQGKIWAENATTGGAIFCFTLPQRARQHSSEDRQHGTQTTTG